MTQINLETISGKGFLSFFDPFEFNLSNYKGKTLQIDGLNKDDLMSKSNGSGKSGLLETVSWGLYGELCRKNRYKDEVIYNRNGVKSKQAVIEIVLDEKGNSYRINRSVEWKKSPELSLWLNEEEILKGATYSTKQEHIEKILGMNFTAFQCCQIFGRDFMSFPDLKPSDRAKVLSDIRNLDKWILASKECGEQIKSYQSSILEKTGELNEINGRISQLRIIDYKSKIKEFEDNRKKEIEDLKAQEISIQNNLNQLKEKQTKEILSLEKQIEEWEKTKKKNEDLLAKLPSFEEEKEKLEKTLSTLSTNNEILKAKLKEIAQETHNFKNLKTGSCPTCKQKITGEHLKKEIDSLNQKSLKINSELENLAPMISEILKQIETVKTSIKSLRILDAQNREIISLIAKTKLDILRLQKSPEEQRHLTTLENLKDRLERLEIGLNPYEKQEEERKKNLFSLARDSKGMQEEINGINQEISYLQFWVDGFKKIRMSLFSTMIDKFQEFAQDLLSQYSSELQIQFSTERETRSGTVKDEFNISVTDSSGATLSWEMYSGGERQKVRLSIARGLAKMIQEDCGIEYNFICFDEPNDALDSVGQNSNFEMFSQIAEEGKMVLVTDHNDLFKDRFDCFITIIKENDKSYIKEQNS